MFFHCSFAKTGKSMPHLVFNCKFNRPIPLLESNTKHKSPQRDEEQMSPCEMLPLIIDEVLFHLLENQMQSHGSEVP